MFPLTHVVLGSGSVWGTRRLLAHLARRENAGHERDTRIDPIDYRLVATGAMLPDFIDKPLGIYLLKRRLSSGRIYGHTLLFGLSLVLTGSLLPRPERYRLLSLGLGVLTHILADLMILSPRSFFWPLAGFAFPRERRPEGWGRRMLRRYYSDPQVMASEGAATLVLLAVATHLSRRGRLDRFLRSGYI